MRGTPPFVELHCHSAYSFLDGASLPQELVERACELGYTALALTDHDSLSGAMEFAMAAQSLPLRPIFGAEVTIGDSPQGLSENPSGDLPEGLRHLTLLVRDGRGWRNLCRLLSTGHAHTREGRDRRLGQPHVSFQDLEGHAEGLVCLSGCATRGINSEEGLRRLLDVFGPDALRVELQRPYARHDRARNRGLECLARRLGVPAVATGDVHAHTMMRARLQDVLVSLRHGLTLDASEVQRRPNHSHVLADPRAMAARFAEHPDAVAETVRLAETLTFDLAGDLDYRYPGAGEQDAIRALSEVCQAGFAERYPVRGPLFAEAAARMEQELGMIDKLGLAGFFVLHHEILQLAREVAVEVRGGGRDGLGESGGMSGSRGSKSPRELLAPGRGRGSSVSSIVCYLTGLSHIDPIASKLAIGRFLHDEIRSLPDIDLDFPRDIRAKLIPRIHEHYGRERSALVAAFPTFRVRGTIRELGKALGLPPGEIERVARSCESWGSAGTVAKDIQAALGERRVAEGRWAWLARLAEEAYGLPRHLSQHSGGMIIATRPLIDCCPVVPAAMAGRQISQWDKDSCADAGFLKIDLLGLGMLSAVERCVELIADHSGECVDLSRIPFDDPETFRCIQNAETTGVFQIESRAQMGSLRRTRPANLEDLTVQVALVRPGPIVGGAVNPYIERRQRLLVDPDYEVPYEHPSLREPLRETLGTIIFQDQVIEVARAFAGFTAGEAEGLRRAMSRKRSEEAMQSHRRQFVQGALETHPDLSQDSVERVWGMVSGFAGFGFPKAHGAAFGLLAYQSTWLRVHHPAAFLCSLLDEQPMGFYPPDSLIHEAQRRGITILAPDVNHSQAECTLTPEGAIRIGLGYVKGVHLVDIEELLRSRASMGRFRDLEDLAARAGVARAVLERLAWSGACDRLVTDVGGAHARRTALWRLGIAKPARAATQVGTQLALDLGAPAAPALAGLTGWESMVADYTTTGISVDRHPLGLLRDRLAARGARSVADLAQIKHGSTIQIAGLVIARQRPGTANGVTFMLLEDEHGTVNLIVPPALYERHRLTIRSEPLVLAGGRLERHASGGGAINILVSALEALRVEEAPRAAIKALPERRPQPVPSAAGGGSSEDGTAEGSSAEDGFAAGAIEELAATGTNDFRAVAPPVTSFGRGRRR
jgi:error-prone DNA polymerase